MQWVLKMNVVRMIFLMLSSASFILGSIITLHSGGSYFIEWELIRLNSTSLVGAFIFDWISIMFISFVTFISSMVLYYRGDYMGADVNVNRFIYLVLGFVGSMGFLIISPNLVRILLG